MKKISLLLTLICLCGLAHFAKAQNVGIGTTTPIDKLTVQTPTNSYGVTHTDGTIFVGTYTGAGYGWLGTKSNHPLAFFTNGGSAQMTIATNGLVGIGTAQPNYGLDILGGNAQINLTSASSGATALLSRYTNRFEISPVDAFQISVGGIARPHFWIGSDGNVGIDNTAPLNKLQIGTVPGFGGNDLAIGNGSQGMSFTQSAAASTWYSSVNFSLLANGGKGYLGIGTQSPANKLQIGSVASTGYADNDIAFGNGTQASAINQGAGVAQWYSTTDIALMPRGNGHGRVGINTTTPRYPLEVDDYVNGPYTLYTFLNDVHHTTVEEGFITPEISIYAANNVDAAEFDAFSDARIKDIQGLSDPAGDLKTLNALQITNYTLKDKVKNGNRPFKKVIAQQVETVYPQVVSKHVDFIPNVYQAASKISKTDYGYLLHFDNAHHISKKATKLKIIASGDAVMSKCDIVSILTDNDIIIKADKIGSDKIFVYGEQVNDFRTVDYEGLSTLNISATQELSKLIKQQQDIIQAQRQEIGALQTKIEALNEKMETFAEDISSLKKKN